MGHYLISSPDGSSNGTWLEVDDACRTQWRSGLQWRIKTERLPGAEL
ncbi:hypothetical protein PGR6_56100 [Pseudomonas sp. GR 6-02]|nr:hypothetical protein PGR6_56100 [Pseudomonas sp. GR 6-02]